MKIKKLVGILTSLACVNLLLTSLEISAESPEEAGTMSSAKYYSSCDVDRNDIVNILDVVLLNRCLTGMSYIPDFYRLDADCNGIVNGADSICVASNAIGKSFVSNTDGLSSSVSYAVSGSYPIISDTSVEYIKYNYATKATGTYTLTITPETATATVGDNTREVIGTDDRQYLTNQPEFNGIVLLEFGLQDSAGINSSKVACPTGFIVGDHQIATAAHGVYNEYSGTYSKGYYFLSDTANHKNRIYFYDKDGNRTGDYVTPVEVHIPKTYYDNPNGEDGTDYALITVKEDLSSYTHFRLGLVKNPYDASFSKANIYVSGIPTVVNGKENNGKKIAKGMGHIYSGETAYLDSMLYYTTDETKGNSGSPIYVVTRYNSGSEYTAIGIVKGGNYTRNRGARITPMLQRFYLNNPYTNY
ncbi:MAG: trypsin-like peptidase domain-containing protein [Oscillospiraceae bacterium]|nr:trypsin-like peptidase domain-containing protein [Oscillospiraceae bacterium]